MAAGNDEHVPIGDREPILKRECRVGAAGHLGVPYERARKTDSSPLGLARATMRGNDSIETLGVAGRNQMSCKKHRPNEGVICPQALAFFWLTRTRSAYPVLTSGRRPRRDGRPFFKRAFGARNKGRELVSADDRNGLSS